MEIHEESVVKAADMVRVWINHVLMIAHDIAIGGNLKLFVKVCFYGTLSISCIMFCSPLSCVMLCSSLQFINMDWFIRLLLACGWYLMLVVFATSSRSSTLVSSSISSGQYKLLEIYC